MADIDTFHCFSMLPTEIRALIWEFAARCLHTPGIHFFCRDEDGRVEARGSGSGAMTLHNHWDSRREPKQTDPLPTLQHDWGMWLACYESRKAMKRRYDVRGCEVQALQSPSATVTDYLTAFFIPDSDLLCLPFGPEFYGPGAPPGLGWSSCAAHHPKNCAVLIKDAPDDSTMNSCFAMKLLQFLERIDPSTNVWIFDPNQKLCKAQAEDHGGRVFYDDKRRLIELTRPESFRPRDWAFLKDQLRVNADIRLQFGIAEHWWTTGQNYMHIISERIDQLGLMGWAYNSQWRKKKRARTKRESLRSVEGTFRAASG